MMRKTKVVRNAREYRKPGPLARDGSRIMPYLVGFAAGILMSLIIVHVSMTFAQRHLAQLKADQAAPAAVGYDAAQT